MHYFYVISDNFYDFRIFSFSSFNFFLPQPFIFPVSHIPKRALYPYKKVGTCGENKDGGDTDILSNYVAE